MTNREEQDTNNSSVAGGGASSETPREEEQRQGPVPPVRYNPNAQLPPVNPPGSGGGNQVGDSQEFFRARRMITVAQIMALVSIFIGGMLLSSAAIVVAILAYQKARTGLNYQIDNATGQDVAWALLKRSATIAIILGVSALIANAAILIIFYPTLLETFQAGDFSAITGSAPSGQETGGSKHSIWG